MTNVQLTFTGKSLSEVEKQIKAFILFNPNLATDTKTIEVSNYQQQNKAA